MRQRGARDAQLVVLQHQREFRAEEVRAFQDGQLEQRGALAGAAEALERGELGV